VGEVFLATPQELRAAIDAEKGNVVVMNFWATWCPPCVQEMPEFAKFWHEHEGKGVKFFSVSADYAGSKDEVVAPFMNSYEIPFPVRIMAVDNPDELTKVLELDWDGALPATFIYGPDSKIAWQTIGGTITRELLVDKITPLLSPAASGGN
jgi:thiol-disulfide isomerase/thioredoxin